MATESLKPGWTRARFGDVVKLCTDRCADPLGAGIERYVGLEHIDPEDLRIRRWGNVADGITFTTRFRPGQVLFGKRRAYQRKVAVADFEGVCSSDIYVFEAKAPSVLLPELLPFICQTEGFFEHAVGTSAGSLSPRTNWGQLAEYEFALPPLEEQCSLAQVYDGAENALTAALSLVDSLAPLTQSYFSSAIVGGCEFEGMAGAGVWPQVPLGELLEQTQYGLSLLASTSGRYPILGISSIADGKVQQKEIEYVDLTPDEFDKYRLCAGDILLNRTNSYELVGRTGLYEGDGSHVFASYLIRLKVDRRKVLPAFINAYLNSPAGRRQVLSMATKGVSQANVNGSNLSRMAIPLPPLDQQGMIVEHLARLDAGAKESQRRLAACKRLKEQLLRLLMKGPNEDVQ